VVIRPVSNPTKPPSPIPVSSAVIIGLRMHDIRGRAINWSWDYGPENMWEAEFQFRLDVAQEKGDEAVRIFLKRIIDHARKGRYILTALR